MFTHPAITEALASQRRRDLITQADAYRLARAARGSGPARPGLFRWARRPASLAQPASRAVTASAAVFAAAAVLIAAPAGTNRWAGPQASAAHFVAKQASAAHFVAKQASAAHFVAKHVSAAHFV
jgi:hypothetical protein